MSRQNSTITGHAIYFYVCSPKTFGSLTSQRLLFSSKTPPPPCRLTPCPSNVMTEGQRHISGGNQTYGEARRHIANGAKASIVNSQIISCKANFLTAALVTLSFVIISPASAKRSCASSLATAPVHPLGPSLPPLSPRSEAAKTPSKSTRSKQSCVKRSTFKSSCLLFGICGRGNVFEISYVAHRISRTTFSFKISTRRNFETWRVGGD